MADEKKLGPNVTYLGNDENDKQSVTMAGVQFRPQESVNLEERLGQQKAAPILQKLAGNTFFKVDGGPDHKAMLKAREAAVAKDAEAEQKAREAREEAVSAHKPPEEATLEEPSNRRRGRGE